MFVFYRHKDTLLKGDFLVLMKIKKMDNVELK